MLVNFQQLFNVDNLFCCSCDKDLDHTADVQLHAWGENLQGAFEHICPCMFNYMTDLTKVDEIPEESRTVSVEGAALHALCHDYVIL